MTKSEDTLRKWLEKTIAKCGGPSKPADEFVLDDAMVVVVGTMAVLDLHVAVIFNMSDDNGITVKEYLDELAKACFVS